MPMQDTSSQQCSGAALTPPPRNPIEHHYDTLYPQSVYRCTVCSTVHGTRAVNGAVNWQCTNSECAANQPGAYQRHIAEFPHDYSWPKQEYLGRRCTYCGEIQLVA